MSAQAAMVPGFDFDAFTGQPGHTIARQNDDGSTYLAQWLYNATGAAVVAGRAYKRSYSGVATTQPSAVAIVTLASVYQKVCVALEATASAAWGYFAVEGYVDAFVNGDATDVTAGDFLTVNDATDDDAFIDNTTTRTVNSMAIYTDTTDETDATPTLRRVYLFPEAAVIP